MSTQEANDRLELRQSTLGLLILRTLVFTSQHGQGTARAIQQTSGRAQVRLRQMGNLSN